MNPKVGEYFVEGWALEAKNGLFLYRGNPNKEYDDMRLACFGTAAFRDLTAPFVFTTKWEAEDRGKKWNALANKKCKGMFCIGDGAKVHPVKVKISIERRL